MDVVVVDDVVGFRGNGVVKFRRYESSSNALLLTKNGVKPECKLEGGENLAFLGGIFGNFSGLLGTVSYFTGMGLL